MRTIKTSHDVENHFEEHVLNFHNFRPGCIIDDKANNNFCAGFVETSGADAGMRRVTFITHDALKHLVAMMEAPDAPTTIAKRSSTMPGYINPITVSMAKRGIEGKLPFFKAVLEKMNALESQADRNAVIEDGDMPYHTADMVAWDYMRNVGGIDTSFTRRPAPKGPRLGL